MDGCLVFYALTRSPCGRRHPNEISKPTHFLELVLTRGEKFTAVRYPYSEVKGKVLLYHRTFLLFIFFSYEEWFFWVFCGFFVFLFFPQGR